MFDTNFTRSSSIRLGTEIHSARKENRIQSPQPAPRLPSTRRRQLADAPRPCRDTRPCPSVGRDRDSQRDDVGQHALADVRAKLLRGHHVDPTTQQHLKVRDEPAEIEQRTPNLNETSKSTSLPTPAVPRATEPKTLTSRAPRSRAPVRMSSRRARRPDSVTGTDATGRSGAVMDPFSPIDRDTGNTSVIHRRSSVATWTRSTTTSIRKSTSNPCAAARVTISVS